MDWRDPGGGSPRWLEHMKYQEMVRELRLSGCRRRRQRRDLSFACNYLMRGNREYETSSFCEVCGERMRDSTGDSV